MRQSQNSSSVGHIWMPQPGPQVLALTCPADIIFFGGSRGGGKTDCALGRQIHGAMDHGYHWSGLFVRKNYKHFKELRRRIDELIMKGLPAKRLGGDNQTNVVRFNNGAQIVFTAVQQEEQLDYFQGQQFTEISIEELCQFPFADLMVEKLKGCLRSPHGVPCQMFATGNPGGPGHSQVKSRFISPHPPGGKPIVDASGEQCMFIPSNVEDNRVLCDNDPKYVNRLKSIQDKDLRRAWLLGDWDVVLGGFFDDIWAKNRDKMILPHFSPPEHWDRVVGFDWGSARPFSVGWYVISGGEFLPEIGMALPRGALVRFQEWYGCVRDKPNVGLRIESTKVAERIKYLEERFQLLGKSIPDRIADPAIFKQEDGPSIGEKMADTGIVFRRADNSRIPGWNVMRDMMRGFMIDSDSYTDQDGNEQLINAEYQPMLYVTEDCPQFIRTIPALERDEKDWEDVDTDGEDHIADEVRYVCASRQGRGHSTFDLRPEKTPMEREFEEIETLALAEDGESSFLFAGEDDSEWIDPLAHGV